MNPTLKGHKVLILLQYEANIPFIEKLQASHPDLDIVWHNIGDKNATLPPNIWETVTVICTYDQSLPTLEQAPNMHLVQLVSSGANHCYGSALYESPKVYFCTSNGIHPPQITEWVFATFLNFQHNLFRYMKSQERCDWDDRGTRNVEDSVGLRLGILGYGAIGRQCARVGKAFGMDVYAYTMRERSTPEARLDDSYHIAGTGDPEGLLPSKWFHGTTKEALNNFLAQDLDLLVICLPLTTLTKGMFGKEQFEILSRKKTFLSNIGRGPIVNTPELIEALEKGQLRGAALDVTDPEPLPKEHPLWKAPNVFISPHISWYSKHHKEMCLDVLAQNLKRMSEGGKLINEVDKVHGF
ncbi:D-3-phosphoglycerate dehydrogenase [Halenospora varia]|nr:D-3-phosphoglycerate dehydrogenase [Halenospora varia]